MNEAPRGEHRSVFPRRARSTFRGWAEAPGSCPHCSWRRRGRVGSRLLDERALGCGLPARTERAFATPRVFGQEGVFPLKKGKPKSPEAS